MPVRSSGIDQGFEDLLQSVYPDLRKHAHRLVQLEHRDPTLQGTALLHEAALALHGGAFKNKQHFVGSMVLKMKNLLTDSARRRKVRVRKAPEIGTPDEPQLNPQQALHLERAFRELAETYPREAFTVAMIAAGFTHKETASRLGVCERTVRRYWAHGRVWLQTKLGE